MLIFINRIVFSLLLVFLASPISAQVDFLQKTFNLGVLENWSETPAEFVLVNRGTNPVAIVNIIKSENIHVKFTADMIQPNQKGIIRVFYEPRNAGYFTRKITVYVSNSAKPIELFIKGRVETILECPAPGASNDFYTSHSFMLNGIVIDGRTNLPVIKAIIRFVTPYNHSFNEKSQKDGRFQRKLEIGMYAVMVEVDGYYPYNEIFHLDKSHNFLCIDLDPIDKTDTLPQADTIIKNNRNTFTLEQDVDENTDISTLNPAMPSATEEILIPLTISGYKPNNLVFLVDISENPELPDKIQQIKSQLKELVSTLRNLDYISFIAYSDTFTRLLYPISCGDKNEINAVIENISLSGNSNGIAGLENAYRLILRNYIPEGNNQIVILTGKFNIPSVSLQTKLYTLGREISYQEIAISIGDLGDNHDNAILKQFIVTSQASYFKMGENHELIKEIKSRSKRK